MIINAHCLSLQNVLKKVDCSIFAHSIVCNFISEFEIFSDFPISNLRSNCIFLKISLFLNSGLCHHAMELFSLRYIKFRVLDYDTDFFYFRCQNSKIREKFACITTELHNLHGTTTLSVQSR